MSAAYWQNSTTSICLYYHMTNLAVLMGAPDRPVVGSHLYTCTIYFIDAFVQRNINPSIISLQLLEVFNHISISSTFVSIFSLIVCLNYHFFLENVIWMFLYDRALHSTSSTIHNDLCVCILIRNISSAFNFLLKCKNPIECKYSLLI